MQRIFVLICQAYSHTGFRRYLVNTGWILGAKILSLGVSFLATLYVARSLGPENFGQLSYAMSFIALFSFLASLGIDTVLYRDLIRSPEKKEEILGTAFTIRIAAGSIAAVLATSAGFLLADNDVSAILIFMLSWTFVFSAFHITLLEFQARAESKYPSIIVIGTAIILNVLKVIIIASGQGVIYLASLFLLESALYAVGYCWLYTKKTDGSIMRWRFSGMYARALLNDSLPLIALGGFSVIYARIDQVLIKHMIDAHAVGIYDAAVRVAELWVFIPGILLAALYPAIVNAKATSENLYNARLARLALALLLIAFVTAFVVTQLAPFIIQVLYGAAFMSGVAVLRIYVWGFIGNSLSFLITQYLVTENYRKILAFVAFVPMVVNIVLNLILIPRLGIAGSAYATLISYSLIPFMLLFFRPTRVRLAAISQRILKRH